MEGHLRRGVGSEIEYLFWGVKQSKSARGSGGMLPREILKLRSSEIAGNVYFSNHFWTFTVFKGGNQIKRKEALCPSL